jgi:hypothetical protein
LGDIGALATAAGVVLVGVQLAFARRQQRTAFEDDLTREYRDIARTLPPEAFFDQLPDGVVSPDFSAHPAFLRYVDLCNQQAFLRARRRIGRRTWAEWAEGMRDNHARDAFRQAHEHLLTHMTESFADLRLLTNDWAADPAWVAPGWWRAPAARFRRQLPLRPRGLAGPAPAAMDSRREQES